MQGAVLKKGSLFFVCKSFEKMYIIKKNIFLHAICVLKF
jgi:hypothetical protein